MHCVVEYPNGDQEYRDGSICIYLSSAGSITATWHTIYKGPK